MNSVIRENYAIIRQQAITGQWIVWEVWHNQQINVRTYYGDTARNESWIDYANRLEKRCEISVINGDDY